MWYVFDVGFTFFIFPPAVLSRWPPGDELVIIGKATLTVVPGCAGSVLIRHIPRRNGLSAARRTRLIGCSSYISGASVVL